MKSTLLHESNGLRTLVVVLDTGEEPMSLVAKFAVEHRLGGSHFTAIGAFSSVVVAYFDWSSKRYQHIPIDEQVEVLSMIGDITIHHDKPAVHAHVVLGKADGSAHGGHLVRASVRPTLEIVITEAPRHMHRVHDAESGLALIDPRRKPATS
jgi:predicted DNA-binding protein with PD1-like motif